MIYSEDPELQAIIERVYKNEQGHIFRFWDHLDEMQQTDLLAQAAECLRTLAHPHRLRMIQMLLAK